MDAAPLAGFRVIDAASYLTGPFAAMMLGDLGADVVKVEPPRGDPFRRFGRRLNGVGVSFINTNRNKRSIALDLADAADRAAFDGLVASADALITNWRPATTRAIGLDETLVERHPQLVWVRITGFGPDGPDADAPAFDSIIQARSGLAWMQGDGAEPTLVRSWVADKVTAMFAAQGALSALLARERTGRGGLVDIPMIDAMAYFNFPDMMVERTALDHGDRPARNRHMATIRPIATADGWILISPVVGRHIAATLRALGIADRQAELKAITDPAELSDALCAMAEDVTRTGPSARWLAALAEHGVPAGPVVDIDTHLTDPQIEHNRTYGELADPVAGPVRAPRYPGARQAPSRPAPVLDADRDVAPKQALSPSIES